MHVVFEYLRPWAHIAQLFGIVAALAIAVGNAWWQSHLQDVDLRHDLFDRRFEIYRSLRDFIHKLTSNGSVKTEDVEALIKHKMAVEFLFGREEVVSFMNEAYVKASYLEMCDAKEVKHGREPPESEKERYQDTRTWYSREATAQLGKLFSDDLRLYRSQRNHGITMKRLNFRRGLNRIYLVLSILWCLWVLWLPVHARDQDYGLGVRFAYEAYDSCLQAGLGAPCSDDRNARLAEAERNTLAKNPYLYVTDGSYAKLLLFPVGMVVPPLVVYGILFGLSRLGLWIINGFRA